MAVDPLETITDPTQGPVSNPGLFDVLMETAPPGQGVQTTGGIMPLVRQLSITHQIFSRIIESHITKHCYRLPVGSPRVRPYI